MTEAYREDLAYIHDSGFGEFVRSAAPGLLAALRREGVRDGLVLDLGCGSGIWAERLAKRGYEVYGIDISAPMIKIASQRVPGGRFRRGSFLRLPFPPCDAVTSIGECFNYLFDDRSGRRELRRLFLRIYENLRQGGVLLFDMLESAEQHLTGVSGRCRQGRNWAVLVHADQDKKGRILTRRITSFRRVGELYRRDHEIHRLRMYRRSEVADELRRSGFRVRFLKGYGEMAFGEGHVGYLARKG